jgi:hypothetical protein
MLVDCHNLCPLYNDEHHGNQLSQKQSKRLAQLKCDLATIFKYKTEVLALEHDIFDTPIHELLTLSLGKITKWITSRKPIILQSRRNA